MSPPTTTSPPEKPPLFEPPELVLDEDVVSDTLGLDITAENFSDILAANFLVAMAARDRKLTREFFHDTLITVMNFQNRLIRIKELNIMLEVLKGGNEITETLLQDLLARNTDLAKAQQYKLQQCLSLFREMRGEEDPVS